MKVNDLTEENIKNLKEGKYVLFDGKNHVINVIGFYTHTGGIHFEYTTYQGEWHDILENFKKQHKDCEMFPIEEVKKPKRDTILDLSGEQY